jgi:hypothetical protein
MRYKHILSALFLILFLGACGAPTPTPTPTAVSTATRGLVATFTPQPPTATPSPTALPTATSEDTATPTPEQPTATPSPTAMVIQVEPTFTPRPGDDRISVRALAIGQPGNYVNVTFGYWVQYPPTWYTGFGNRPLLVSFSNLDPGTHNRQSMRTEGCLIEINALANIYGFTFQDLAAQMPRSFVNAEHFDLDGEPAVRARHSIEESPFESEWIFVQHDDRLFSITLGYARDAGEICRPVWENLLTIWQWFEPDFVIYRNPKHGYAISHPRRWYRFNPRERGISISSQDPTDLTDRVEFLQEGAMLVETDVFDNPDHLPLKEWLAAQDWEIDLTNDIPLDGLVGVRVLQEGPTLEIQEMSGYFQGPLGGIYEVTCRYPADREWEFRPIANAIIYSFSF